MTFDEKEAVWKHFIEWGKKTGKFKNQRDLGEKMGYSHRSWASKLIHQARTNQVEFPGTLWRMVLAASMFGAYEFPANTSTRKPKEYPVFDDDLITQ